MVRTAIIGFGRMGRKRAESIINNAVDACVVAAAKNTVTNSDLEYAEDHQIVLYDDYREMLENEDIDAVIISVPSDQHAKITLEVLDMGKHVFVEKPCALELKDARLICDKVKETGLKYQIGFNRRIDRDYREMHDLVANGTIGKVNMIRLAERDLYVPPEKYIAHSGGMILDFQIHDLDMIRYITGLEIEEVFAWGSAIFEPEMLGKYDDIDTGTISMRLSNGGYATIDACRFSAERAIDRRCEVSGDYGHAEMPNVSPNNVVVMTRDGARATPRYPDFLSRFHESYQKEIRLFVDAIENDTPVCVTAEDGYKAVQAALAVNLSMKEHRVVKLDEITE